MRFPLAVKVGSLAIVGLMLLLVLSRIEGLVGERKARGEEAVRGVERSHAAAQSVLGPVIQRFCVEEYDEASGTGNERVVAKGLKREFTLTQVPGRLVVDGRTQADPLRRGLFKINAWTGHFVANAEFPTLVALQPHAEHADGRLRCSAPVVMVALSDVRGVRAATLAADNKALPVTPGTGAATYASGLHAQLADARVDGDAAAQPLAVRVELDLVGTSQLAWVPAADSLRWTLHSD